MDAPATKSILPVKSSTRQLKYSGTHIYSSMTPVTRHARKHKKQQKQSTAPSQARCICTRYPELPQQKCCRMLLVVRRQEGRASHSIFYLSSSRNRKTKRLRCGNQHHQAGKKLAIRNREKREVWSKGSHIKLFLGGFPWDITRRKSKGGVDRKTYRSQPLDRRAENRRPPLKIR